MGSLADKKCVQGQRVSGILVKKNFNYHILNPSDLSSESNSSKSVRKDTDFHFKRGVVHHKMNFVFRSVHRAGYEHGETVPGHPLHGTLLAARLPSEEPHR